MNIIEETDTRYYISNSTLPNAGYGLFAKELLKKDDWLEIIGVMVKNGSIADKCTHYAKRYKFAGSKLTAKIVPMGYAGIINHCDDPIKQNCQITVMKGLIKRNPDASEVVYRFTRDILPEEELLGDYGQALSNEIKKYVDNVNYYQENFEEINKLLKYNLYDLPKIFNSF